MFVAKAVNNIGICRLTVCKLVCLHDVHNFVYITCLLGADSCEDRLFADVEVCHLIYVFRHGEPGLRLCTDISFIQGDSI